MSYVEVNTTWTVKGTGGGGNTASGTGTAFNTDTKQIEQWYGSRNLAILDPKPPDAHLSVGTLLWFECDADLTATKWFYAGGMDVRLETEERSEAYCGYTPPLTCQLGLASVQQTLLATGAKLTVRLSGTANGGAWYSLDGGKEQSSSIFSLVLPGRHVLTVRDEGLAGCTSTVEVEVAEPVAEGPPPAPAAPLGPAEGIDLVGQPLWYSLADLTPGARVELELYAESAHGAEDFARVLTLRKLADAAGRVSFRLDTLLWPLLRASVPAAEATSRCTSNLMGYFVRTATVAGAASPVYQLSPLRVALRGGLPAEWVGSDYVTFQRTAFALPSFLSWQPYGPGTYAGAAAKPVVEEQPEWLFWLVPAPAKGLRVARAYDMGPGTVAVVDYEVLGAAPARGWVNQLLAIPLRPARAGFARLRVQVQDADGQPLSASAWYRFVEPTPRTRYLLFTNSLGGLDTLRCEGRLDVTLEAATDKVERPARLSDAPATADRQVSDLTASRKLRLATGWLTPAELAWLQDLVLSRELWQVAINQLRPLDWSKRSLATYSDEPGLRGLLLDCDYAFAPTAYAPGTY